MKWINVIEQVNDIPEQEELNQIDVKGINENSADIEKGSVFVAIEGYEKDGHDYIDHAVEQGAALVVGQKAIKNLPVPYIQVSDSRKILGQLATNFYGHPCRNKLVIGITGTNGKTTTGLLTTHLLRKAGYTVSFFGTVFNEMNGKRLDSSLTTPSASMIQKALSESDDEVVVIEVSSQGLQQHRMEGMAFDYGLFTNLQHDHLDYHKTIDDYFLAKKKLFSLLKPKGKAIVNRDNPWGGKLVDLLKEEGREVLTVGETEEADTRYIYKESNHSELEINHQAIKAQAPLPGKYNLLNLSMATTVLHDLGKNMSKLEEMIADLEPIPGRFEVYELTSTIKGIVDYAHTAEALEAVLSTISSKYPGYKLTHVFGFRGKRDESKRQNMVNISAKFCDRTILTVDDLNGVKEENMHAAYTELIQSLSAGEAEIVMDRTKAISKLFTEAEEPTIILVTGKGHEKYKQTFALPVESDKETFIYLTEQA
ncbi:UDP-N-acetylmuramoyl-L-alanyl-D-glutamate--2,6-diaminopimelate ligase [Alkalibacterium psychrotolerans]